MNPAGAASPKRRSSSLGGAPSKQTESVPLLSEEPGATASSGDGPGRLESELRRERNLSQHEDGDSGALRSNIQPSTRATAAHLTTNQQRKAPSPATKKTAAQTTGPEHNPKYKLTMCQNWVREGKCSYTSRCQFAHGEHEIEKWAHKRALVREHAQRSSSMHEIPTSSQSTSPTQGLANLGRSERASSTLSGQDSRDYTEPPFYPLSTHSTAPASPPGLPPPMAEPNRFSTFGTGALPPNQQQPPIQQQLQPQQQASMITSSKLQSTWTSPSTSSRQTLQSNAGHLSSSSTSMSASPAPQQQQQHMMMKASSSLNDLQYGHQHHPQYQKQQQFHPQEQVAPHALGGMYNGNRAAPVGATGYVTPPPPSAMGAVQVGYPRPHPPQQNFAGTMPSQVPLQQWSDHRLSQQQHQQSQQQQQQQQQMMRQPLKPLSQIPHQQPMAAPHQQHYAQSLGRAAGPIVAPRGAQYMGNNNPPAGYAPPSQRASGLAGLHGSHEDDGPPEGSLHSFSAQLPSSTPLFPSDPREMDSKRRSSITSVSTVASSLSEDFMEDAIRAAVPSKRTPSYMGPTRSASLPQLFSPFPHSLGSPGEMGGSAIGGYSPWTMTSSESSKVASLEQLGGGEPLRSPLGARRLSAPSMVSTMFDEAGYRRHQNLIQHSASQASSSFVSRSSPGFGSQPSSAREDVERAETQLESIDLHRPLVAKSSSSSSSDSQDQLLSSLDALHLGLGDETDARDPDRREDVRLPSSIGDFV